MKIINIDNLRPELEELTKYFNKKKMTRADAIIVCQHFISSIDFVQNMEAYEIIKKK